MHIAGLYFYSRYPEWYGEPGDSYWDYDNDYDYYMNELNESSKYEVHFKCVKEPSPEPVSDSPITIEENNGVTTVSMVDNSDTAVEFSRNLSCGSGIVQLKIVSISGLSAGEDDQPCEKVGNYAQFVYRKI